MAQGLDITFQTNDRPVPALSDVLLMVNQGDVVSFNGASGRGKTTLQRANAARDAPTGGGVSVVSLDAAWHAGVWIRVPGGRSLPNMRPRLDMMGYSRGDQDRGMKNVMEPVEALRFGKEPSWQLSEGMQQRTSIAGLLLMEEPVGALDEIVHDPLAEEPFRLSGRTRKTRLFVTHAIPLVDFLTTKSVVTSPRSGRSTDAIDNRLPTARPPEVRGTPGFAQMAQRARAGLRVGHGDVL